MLCRHWSKVLSAAALLLTSALLLIGQLMQPLQL